MIVLGIAYKLVQTKIINPLLKWRRDKTTK